MDTVNQGVSRDESTLIKAIALLMMLYHHLFGFADSILIPNPYITLNLGGYSLEAMIAAVCKLCVCIFAFLTGYGICYSYQSKSLWERLKKAISKSAYIYFAYVMTLLLVFLPIAFICGEEISGTELLENLCMVKTNLLPASWYVPFYIESVFALALLRKAFNKHILIAALICIALTCLFKLFGNNVFLHYFPSVVMGYIFARWSVYEVVCRKIKKVWQLFLAGGGLLAVLLLLRLRWGDSIGPLSLVTFFAPILVYEIKLLLVWTQKFKRLRSIGFFIAKYSMFYWLIHSVANYGIVQVQRLIYAPRLPVLILIWTVVIMTPLAMILSGLLNMGKQKITAIMEDRKNEEYLNK